MVEVAYAFVWTALLVLSGNSDWALIAWVALTVAPFLLTGLAGKR